ncbi:NAD-dependent epimerase [Candidatus Roizmanbacteria bacterium CG22_combo_CG10-13_8_21_14_all_38_20]|uniref:NAD-dependent epimerase n=1 Tax=Candidatus Roizmanbacteria bacterium CG22_combo_CG10-13_8_21_14_all_38_20 TaxID=1974862 RepID=A0A2H0BUW6_9BACT|nr:MAG: NAD-dependent epimerase [Candidatus Roizmanbacteria bacterium CG22_combo_CG10-13_8_21_14_all_38_20]PJC30519.1 MAG: NAD-dependent epimerase [Candidatus Roizmanbacteria bacterium CG_4_9_14_0_2_um_filter_38_17]
MTKNHLQQFYSNKEILITGGLGFIGSNLAIALVKLGAHVTLIDSLIPDYGGNLFNIQEVKNKLNINISDVRDRPSINYLVKDKDILFNLAGTLSHIDSMTDPFTDLEVNCVSQLSILEACRLNNPLIKIVWAGTRNQYGRPTYLPVDENHPQVPTDVNGINNIAGEQYHLLYFHIYGIKTTSLRLTNCYGPRHQMKHSRQGVLNWFLRQLIDSNEIKLMGAGSQIRDINYVDDVVDAFLLSAASDNTWGQAFNLGGEAVSLEEFIKTAITVYGKGKYSCVEFSEDRKKIEVGSYIANWEKFNKYVGWKPMTTLENGIKLTLNFYEKNKNYYWD